MKSLLRGLFVGILLLGLSGLAGAEEWKRVALHEYVDISMEVPASLEKRKWEVSESGGFTAGFLDTSDVGSLGVIISSFSMRDKKESPYGRYILDSFNEADQRAFLDTEKEYDKNLTNYRYQKLKNGHLVLLRENIDENLYVMSFSVDQYYVSIKFMIWKDSVKQLEMLDRLLDSMVF